MKNQKGITLIALVITIIVLLILAGVSIAMLTGDNGLLTKSDEAAMDNVIAGAKDEISLESQAYMATYYENKYVKNESGANPQNTVQGKLAEYLGEDGKTVKDCTVEISDNKVTITYETRKVEGNIQSDGTLKWDSITDNK